MILKEVLKHPSWNPWAGSVSLSQAEILRANCMGAMGWEHKRPIVIWFANQYCFIPLLLFQVPLDKEDLPPLTKGRFYKNVSLKP